MTDLLRGLSEDDRKIARMEAMRLLQLLPITDESRQAMALLPVYLPAQGNVGSRKLLKTDYPLASMLHWRPATNVPRLAEREWLRAWALVAALRFCGEYSETDRFSRVSAGLRAVRRISCNVYQADLISELADIDNDLNRVIRAVGRLEDTLRLRSHKLTLQVSQLRLLLLDARAPVGPRGGGGSPRNMQDDELQPQLTIQQGDLGVTFETAGPMSPGLPPEEYAEEMRPVLYDFGRHRITLPEGQGGSWQQLDLLDLQAQESGWTHSHAALTAHEAQLIAAAALKGAQEGGRAAKLVLLSLVTGRSFAALMAIKNQPQLGGSWKPDQCSLCFSPDVTDLHDPLKNGYRMEFPDRLNIWAWSREGDIEEDVRKWLGSLGLNRRPRMARIERALADALLARKSDTAAIALLTGASRDACVQVYYAAFSVMDLSKPWSDCLKDAFKLAAGFSLHALNPKRPMVGSILAPERAEVAQWFHGLRQRFEQAQSQANSLLDMPTVLSEAAHFSVAVLSFLTARRPHRNAFEPLSRVAGRHKMRVLLEGKGGRESNDDRWVPLCAGAQLALQLWLEGLDHLEAIGIGLVNVDLRQRTDAVRAGRSGLFFKWPDYRALPQDMTASELVAEIGTPRLHKPRKRDGVQTLAPVNWARHYMRRELYLKGISGHVIDGFFGHTGAACDPYAPMSATALADQEDLRAALQVIWDDLGINMPSWSQFKRKYPNSPV